MQHQCLFHIGAQEVEIAGSQLSYWITIILLDLKEAMVESKSPDSPLKCSSSSPMIPNVSKHEELFLTLTFLKRDSSQKWYIENICLSIFLRKIYLKYCKEYKNVNP